MQPCCRALTARCPGARPTIGGLTGLSSPIRHPGRRWPARITHHRVSVVEGSPTSSRSASSASSLLW